MYHGTSASSSTYSMGVRLHKPKVNIPCVHINNIGACDARNLEESCGQGGRGDLRMVRVSPSWPWLVAWTSPSTCTRALSHRENMRLWMGMKAQKAAWPADGIPDGIFMGRYMAKWGSGEASGSRSSCHTIGIFCMAGVRTIIFDGLRGLLRLLELTLAISPARDRRSLSAGPSADNRNPNRKRGVGGPKICLGMGSYRSLAAESLAVAGAGRYLPNNHL